MQTPIPAQPSNLTIVMRSLADPTRRDLFERIIAARETTVSALAANVPVSQPAVSQHLKALRRAGLLSERRDGRNTFYRADPEGFAPLVDWLDHYAVFWRDRFDALKTLLKEMDQ